MPLTISKNKFAYSPDTSLRQVEYTNTQPITVAHTEFKLLEPSCEFDADEKVHHVRIQLHGYFPGAPVEFLPEFRVSCTSARGGETRTVPMVPAFEPSSGECRGVISLSHREPITEISFMLLPNDAQRANQLSATVPPGARVHVSIEANDAPLTVHVVSS